MKEIEIQTHQHAEFVDITRGVAAVIADLGVRNGVVSVFVPHTTAGVTINENADPDVPADMIAALERVVPWQANYRHSEGKAAAHVKASMMGASVRIIVKDARLLLGTWQAIYLCEFDGPRSRRVWIEATSVSDTP